MRAPVWLLLLCLLPGAAGAAPFEPTPDASKTYSESYTAIALLEDGTYVHASLMVSNIGLHNGRGLCKVRLWRPGVPPETHEQLVEKQDWYYRKARGKVPAVLQMGPCRALAASDSVIFDLPFAAAGLRLTLQRRAEAVVPPGHPVRVDDKEYRSEILVPFARAELRATDPSTALTAQLRRGFGYVDHSRSTTLPADLGHGWLRFRGFAPGCGRLLLVRFVAPALGAQPPRLVAYRWHEGDAAPTALQSPQVTLPAASSDVKDIRLSLFDGQLRLYTLVGNKALLREAPLEAYGFLGKLVGSVIGSVLSETFTATLEDPLAKACKHVPGVLEIDHVSR